MLGLLISLTSDEDGVQHKAAWSKLGDPDLLTSSFFAFAIGIVFIGSGVKIIAVTCLIIGSDVDITVEGHFCVNFLVLLFYVKKCKQQG